MTRLKDLMDVVAARTKEVEAINQKITDLTIDRNQHHNIISVAITDLAVELHMTLGDTMCLRLIRQLNNYLK